MPCSARATLVSLGLAFRKLAQARPANRDVGRADASESHLRIPAEYHCRPREQRETGNNGRVGTRGMARYRVVTMKKKEEAREGGRKEERATKEEQDTKEGKERVHRLERLFVSVSYVFPPVSLLFAATPRCIVALSNPTREQDRKREIFVSLGYSTAFLNSYMTLQVTILHFTYTMTSNDITRH